MKHYLIMLALLIFTAATASAQDLITTKTGEDIKAKVLGTIGDQVTYKLYDNLSGPTYSLAMSELLIIRYENGTKQIFQDATSAAPDTTSGPASLTVDMYRKGFRDGYRQYNGHKEAATVVFVASALLGPLGGLIPATITSATPPREHNLNLPEEAPLLNYEYYQGYRKGAYKKKYNRVWTNFGIGSALSLAVFFMLTH